MKYNLKNVPWVTCVGDVCDEKDMEKLSKWFEGFEKELRRLAKQLTKGEYDHSLIKEILGES